MLIYRVRAGKWTSSYGSPMRRGEYFIQDRAIKAVCNACGEVHTLFPDPDQNTCSVTLAEFRQEVPPPPMDMLMAALNLDAYSLLRVLQPAPAVRWPSKLILQIGMGACALGILGSTTVCLHIQGVTQGHILVTLALEAIFLLASFLIVRESVYAGYHASR